MLGVIVTILIEAVAPADVAHDAAVREFFWELMTMTRYGFAETEEAAFIVVSNGSLSFVRWSSAEVPHQARWEGPFPEGTVAIVHTHPNWIPSPSAVDVQTAQRSRLPVYVITRHRISKTKGGKSEIVFEGDWRNRERVSASRSPHLAASARMRE
jgi:proteasome lid subunit RPN8/RPN11